jgi:hypothetical protein
MRVLQSCVAHVFEVPDQGPASPDRAARKIDHPRAAAMYRTPASCFVREIGRRLGGRGVRRQGGSIGDAQALMVTDEAFREKVEQTRREFVAITGSFRHG